MISTIKISQEILAGQEIVAHITPPNGQVKLFKLILGQAFSTDSVCKVIEDWGGGSEKLIWTSKGDNLFEEQEDIIDGDGAKKVALSIENAGTDNLFLSAKALIEHE